MLSFNSRDNLVKKKNEAKLISHVQEILWVMDQKVFSVYITASFTTSLMVSFAGT